MIFHYCSVCGRVVMAHKTSEKDVFCCETPMTVLEPNTTKSEMEIHQIVKRQIGYFLTVSLPKHPVMDLHRIEFIAIETDQGFQFRAIEKGQEPIANFILSKQENILHVYAFCNIHLLLQA